MMRDAQHYLAHARSIGHPVSDLSADQVATAAPILFWQAATPLEEALSAPLAPKGLAVEAYVSEGRWVVRCPDCGSAQLTAITDQRFMCNECANIAVEGKWRRVAWPSEAVEIETALDERATVNQHWRPGETADDLRVEQAAHVALEEESMADQPNWEGHTHTWPTRLPRSAGAMVSCDDCGLTIPAEVVAEDRKAQQ